MVKRDYYKNPDNIYWEELDEDTAIKAGVAEGLRRLADMIVEEIAVEMNLSSRQVFRLLKKAREHNIRGTWEDINLYFRKKEEDEEEAEYEADDEEDSFYD